MSTKASLEATLQPADQSRDWLRRWKETQRELAELLVPLTGGMSGEAIHAARNRLHWFYVQAYHIKDALKEEAGTTGVSKKAVEAAIDAEPALALLADLANLDKHGNLSKPPRSGHVPTIVRATGTRTSESDGWRLNLEILHDGKHLDGMQVAQDAIDAWQKVLTGWGLL